MERLKLMIWHTFQEVSPFQAPSFWILHPYSPLYTVSFVKSIRYKEICHVVLDQKRTKMYQEFEKRNVQMNMCDPFNHFKKELEWYQQLLSLGCVSCNHYTLPTLDSQYLFDYVKCIYHGRWFYWYICRSIKIRQTWISGR